MRAGAAWFIAEVDGARDTIIAIDIRRVCASDVHVARLDAVARIAVVADVIIGCVDAGARLRIARINGAQDVVVAIGSIACDAEDAIAGFDAVASVAVVALRIHRAWRGGGATTERRDAVLTIGTKGRIGCRRAGSIRFGAAFDGARDIVGIGTLHRRAGDAAGADWPYDAARFDAITRQAVIADVVVRHETARIGGFIAAISRAGSAVIANDGAPRLAPDARIACFDAIAIQTIAAGRVASDMIASIVRFIAAISGAGDIVIAIDRRACLATKCLVARFDAVAEKAVRTKIVICDVRACIHLQVAEVVGTRNIVIAIERRAIHAAEQ